MERGRSFVNARIVLATVILSVISAQAMAQSTWDLCPQPTEALNAVPANIDQLQADIDRFTLCLNRAELLLKLEDLKNQNKTDMASANGMDLPIEPTPLTDQQTGQLLGADPSGVPAAPTSVLSTPNALPAKEEAPKDAYVIREVRGLSGVLVARLQSTDGNYEQVKIGDKLADGSEVTAITTTQVTVQKGGTVKRLGWEN